MARNKRSHEKSGAKDGERATAESLADDDMRRLLWRLESCPPEVIRIVLRKLRDQKPTLQVLKYAGPKIRSQVEPIVHKYLTIPLDNQKGGSIEQALIELHTMPFFRHVQHVSLWAFSDTPGNRPYPHRFQYFIALEILSKLENLRSVTVHCPASWDRALVSVLDIVGTLPLVKNLQISRHVKPECQFPVQGKGSIAYTDSNEVDEASFPSLLRLSVSNLGADSLHWLCSQLNRSLLNTHTVASLSSLTVRTDCINCDALIALVASQSASLRKLQIDLNGGKEDCTPSVHGPIILPHLWLFTCVCHSDYKPDESSSGVANLLQSFQAPRLGMLGCGHVMDGHRTEVIEALLVHWRQSFPKLLAVLTRHLEPPFLFHFSVDNARNALLRRNIEVFEDAFDDTEISLICLEEDDYDDYFKENMLV